MKTSTCLFLLLTQFSSLSFSITHPPTDYLQQPQTQVQKNDDIFSQLENLKCSEVKELDCKGLFRDRPATSTQVGLLTNGDISLAARLMTLKNAKKSIRIQALVLKGDESGRKIANLLIKKKKEGLVVKIVVDAFSNLDLETQLLYYKLKINGIELEGYEAAYLQWINEVSITDLGRPDKRFHDKMWIIDGEDKDSRVAIVGGMNIANEYFRVGVSADKIWRDQDFLVKGDVIDDITVAFDRNFEDQKQIKASNIINTDDTWGLWNKLMSEKLKLHPLQKLNKTILDKIRKIESKTKEYSFETMPAKIKFIQNRPRYGETYIEQSYEKVFSSATKSIFMVNAYFIPSEKVIEALKKAVRNGAKVTLITNSPETNDLPQMAIASRYLYKNLLSVNDEPNVIGKLEIYEWMGHLHNEGTIHAKFSVIDEKIVIGGSYNLDPRSANLNSETVIVFQQPILATQLVQFIKENDLKKSILITKEQAETFKKPEKIEDKLLLYIWNFLAPQL